MLLLLTLNMLKLFNGKKTDTKDSVWITDIFKHGLVEGSFMPPLDIRQLRDLMRYRFKLVNCKSSEKNRFQNSLTVSNIMISNIVTDTFGKTSKFILELILSKEDTVTLKEITPLLRKNLKSTPKQILESVQGNLTHEQNSKMKICLNHYDTLLECIDQIEKAVLPLLLPYCSSIILCNSSLFIKFNLPYNLLFFCIIPYIKTSCNFISIIATLIFCKSNFEQIIVYIFY